MFEQEISEAGGDVVVLAFLRGMAVAGKTAHESEAHLSMTEAPQALLTPFGLLSLED